MQAMVEVVRLDFSGGKARDTSGYANHGSVIGPEQVPPEPTRPAALHFDGLDDRVIVRPSASLTSRAGLLVDTNLRFASLPHRSTIAEGYLSFSLSVDPDGSAVGAIYSGGRWHDVHGPPGKVSEGRWARVTFAAIPPDTLALTVDGTVVARAHVYFGRLGDIQWPYGLNIGGWPDANVRMLSGDLDRFRVHALMQPGLWPPALYGED